MNDFIGQDAQEYQFNNATLPEIESSAEQNTMAGKNWLKTRDDSCPVCFTVQDNICRLVSGSNSTWATEEFRLDILRERIEPWLTSLFQSDETLRRIAPSIHLHYCSSVPIVIYDQLVQVL